MVAGVWAVGFVGLVLAVGAAAQAPVEACRTLPYGPADAVTASPANHKVLFEDADVRVLDVHSQPHTRETVHTHLLPSVMYFERSGAGDYDSADGSVHRSHATDPNFKPEVRAIKPEGPHYTTNTGDVPFHAVRVEFRHPGCGLAGWKAAGSKPAGPGPEAPTEGRTVLFENDEVRVIDVHLPAHAKEAAFTSVWPGVLYVAEGEPVRFAAGEDARLTTGAVVPEKAGEVSLENLGAGPLHLIWFELKYGSGVSQAQQGR